VELIPGAVFEGDGFGLEKKRTVACEVSGGDLGYFTVDLGTGRNDNVAVLHNIAGYAAVEGLSLFGESA
jgi:hypothetical protein